MCDLFLFLLTPVPPPILQVALLEGQIAKTLGENLVSVREYVMRREVLEQVHIYRYVDIDRYIDR